MKKRTKSSLLCALFACLIACLSFVFAFTLKVKAEDEELQASYALNETLVLPKGKISYNDKEYEATDVSLVYPSGLVKAGDTHLLNESGVYTVRYEATADGKTLREEKEFQVDFQKFSVNTVNSSFEYGAHEYAPAKEGLVVSLANQDVLTLNQIIDVSTLTKNDNIISLFYTPENPGTADANKVRIILTDVYDPTNYVTIEMRSLSQEAGAWADTHTFIMANAAGQLPMGAVHTGDQFGYPVYLSMTGNKWLPFGSRLWTYSLDYASRSVWTPDECLFSCQGHPIADLDDLTRTNAPWDGFTTGEVYLSIQGLEYNASKLNFVITDIIGVDLSMATFADDKAPVIETDFGGYKENDLPVGIVGEPYKIFEAKATDNYTENVRVSSNVYVRHNSIYQSECYVNDGYFVASTPGVHTIVYTATDRFGNIATKTVDVQVIADAENLRIALTDKISGNVEAGQTVSLFSDLQVTGATGITSVKVTVEQGDKTYVVEDPFTFTPLYVGKYTVKVEYADYVRMKVELFEFETIASKRVTILDTVILPTYFVRGQSYTLPVLEGYDVSNGTPEKIQAKAYIVEDDAAEHEVGYEAFTVNAKTSFKVVYKLNNGTNATQSVYDCKVVDVGFGDVISASNYFHTTCGNVSVTATDTEMKLTTDTESSKVAFINAVQVESFELKFHMDQTDNAFDQFSVWMTDSVDPSQKVKFTYKRKAGLTYFSVNDGNEILLSTMSFDGTSADVFMLFYDNESGYARPTISIKSAVSKTVNGERFDGFTSKKVYLEFEFNKVSGTSSVLLYSINNQTFFNFDIDIMSPQLFVKNSVGDLNIGDKVTIHEARVYDVLDNACSLIVRVLSPSKTFLTSDDGVVLNGKCDADREYVLTVTEYGNYTVMYQAEDSSGNVLNYKYAFKVVENIAPNIQIDTQTQYAKVGSTVSLRPYAVSDNITVEKNIGVQVYVMDSDYRLTQVDETKMTFKPTMKGAYTVYYWCYDEAYNSVVVSYQLIIS